MNGLYALMRYGLNHCFGGFGLRERLEDSINCRDVSFADFETSLGFLAYEPSDIESAESVIDELATLLTSGRLSPQSRQVLKDAYKGGYESFLQSQMLIATTPEFHSTNLVRHTEENREADPPPGKSDRPYKALVYLLLEGGVDSFNMLAPHTCSDTNSAGQTLLQQYYSERTTIAMTEEERIRIIDATGQPCEQFAIHEDLPIVERLYNDGDLAFFANTGVLDAPVTKDNYYSVTRTELFAHNTMQQEAQRIDPWDSAPGTGILGRMCDVLLDKGYNPQPITVS